MKKSKNNKNIEQASIPVADRMKKETEIDKNSKTDNIEIDGFSVMSQSEMLDFSCGTDNSAAASE